MSFPVFSDEYFMNEALKEAARAYDEQEIPVGAVIVADNRIIARAHNMTEQLQDVTAHAEILAITAASNHLGSKYLNGCTLFVTLEPCLMCASALAWAQIDRIVYGAGDSRAGYTVQRAGVLHPRTLVTPGILELPGSELLKRFFLERRDLKN
ncbi:MAG: nucleoside deaminase [Bacteroidota bacterium]